MRKMLALLITTAFILGTTGFAVAQTPAPAPTQEKKMDEKAVEKKPAKKKAMSLEEKKEACLSKAGTDDAKKAKCEKNYETAKAKMEKKQMKAEKKEEKK